MTLHSHLSGPLFLPACLFLPSFCSSIHVAIHHPFPHPSAWVFLHLVSAHPPHAPLHPLPTGLSSYLLICLSGHPFIYSLFTYLPTHVSICPSVHPSIHPSSHPPSLPTFLQSMHPSSFPPSLPPSHLPIHPPFISPSLPPSHPSIYPSSFCLIHPSFHPSMHPSSAPESGPGVWSHPPLCHWSWEKAQGLSTTPRALGPQALLSCGTF